MSNFTTWRSLVDGEEIVTIPDSEVDQENILGHYDAIAAGWDNNETVTTWEGLQETADLSGGSPEAQSDGINGNLSLYFDGTDDELSNNDISSSVPNTVFVVTEVGDTNQDGRLFGEPDSNGGHNIRWDEGQWGLFNGGSTVRASSTDSEPLALLTAHFGTDSNGGDLILRQNGTEIISENEDGRSLNGISVGQSRNDYYEGWISAVVVANVEVDSSTVQDEEQRLADRYGIDL